MDSLNASVHMTYLLSFVPDCLCAFCRALKCLAEECLCLARTSVCLLRTPTIQWNYVAIQQLSENGILLAATAAQDSRFATLASAKAGKCRRRRDTISTA